MHALRLCAVIAGVSLLLAAAPVSRAERLLDPVGDTPPVPALALPSLDGAHVDIEELRGRVVLVNFWATWCPPCRKEMPSLQRLWHQLGGDDFEVLAVDVGESGEQVRQFLDTLDVTLRFPILLDEDGAVTPRWPVVGLPTTYVVSRDGRLVYQALGERDWSSEEMVQRLEAIIAGNESAKPGPAVLAATGVLLAGLGIAGGLIWRGRR